MSDAQAQQDQIDQGVMDTSESVTTVYWLSKLIR